LLILNSFFFSSLKLLSFVLTSPSLPNNTNTFNISGPFWDVAQTLGIGVKDKGNVPL